MRDWVKCRWPRLLLLCGLLVGSLLFSRVLLTSQPLQERYEQIHIGMTKEEVSAVLDGQPAPETLIAFRKASTGDIWDDGKSAVVVWFNPEGRAERKFIEDKPQDELDPAGSRTVRDLTCQQAWSLKEGSNGTKKNAIVLAALILAAAAPVFPEAPLVLLQWR
jgi:hypothetical protein